MWSLWAWDSNIFVNTEHHIPLCQPLLLHNETLSGVKSSKNTHQRHAALLNLSGTLTHTSAAFYADGKTEILSGSDTKIISHWEEKFHQNLLGYVLTTHLLCLQPEFLT